jgi:hypothetical protein
MNNQSQPSFTQHPSADHAFHAFYAWCVWGPRLVRKLIRHNINLELERLLVRKSPDESIQEQHHVLRVLKAAGPHAENGSDVELASVLDAIMASRKTWWMDTLYIHTTHTYKHICTHTTHTNTYKLRINTCMYVRIHITHT